MLEARAALAAFLGVRVEDLAFVPNATSGGLQRLRDEPLDPDEQGTQGWVDVYALGRKLTAAAGLVVHHETEQRA